MGDESGARLPETDATRYVGVQRSSALRQIKRIDRSIASLRIKAGVMVVQVARVTAHDYRRR